MIRPRSLCTPLAAVLLVCLSLLGPILAQSTCATTSYTISSTGKRWNSYRVASVEMGSDQGWRFLPTGSAVCASALVRNFTVTASGKTLPYYITTDVDRAKVDRLVLVAAGRNRDTWSYFNLMRNARNKAAALFPGRAYRTRTLVVAPMFFNLADRANGAVRTNEVYWHGDDWSDGSLAAGPGRAAQKLSSFAALDLLLDELVRQYPSVREVVVAGHSMGAQLFNRYSAIKDPRRPDVRPLRFFVANPGSWLWMDSSRPAGDPAGCGGYDAYKYGLNESIPVYAQASYQSTGGRQGVLRRLLRRNVHVALVGERDVGPGDTRCQATVQGANHRERGYNYRNAIVALNGGSLPATWTFDQVPGCSHDDWCMFSKKVALQYLFVTKAADGVVQNGKRGDASIEADHLDDEEDREDGQEDLWTEHAGEDEEEGFDGEDEDEDEDEGDHDAALLDARRPSKHRRHSMLPHHH